MKKLYIVLLLFVISVCSFAQRSQDSLALVALYNATDGANWNNNTNWLSSEPISSWYGVTVSGDRVIKIQLSSNNLKGSLPSQIGNLSYLQELILPNNKISGTIPTAIGNLYYLIRLYLYSNQLSGTIPNELGNLYYLEQLVLYNNQLSGTIPTGICYLPSLTDLVLNNNQLSGTLPSALENLQSLQVLWLDNNQFTGVLPFQLGDLTNLIVLRLNNNQFSGSVPSYFGNLANLQDLYLHNNKLTGLPNLSLLTSLGRLYVFSNLLDFADLETAAVDWTNPNYIYYPQDFIFPVNKSISGSDNIYTVDCSYPGATFQWYKDGDVMEGETNISLTVPISDPGIFTCFAEHTDFPSLKLSSEVVGNVHGGVTLADSLALIAIYNATGGANWINKTNWLSTEPVSKWFGVNTSAGRIIDLILYNNNLSGTLPGELNNLNKLQVLGLHQNKITGLTDMSGLALTNLAVFSNLLDFADLGSAMIDWTNANYEYSPQDLILPVNKTVSGSDNIFTVDYSYPGTTLQWYKYGGVIEGETASSLTAPVSDPGLFICYAKHYGFPSLTLSSELVGIEHGGVSLPDSLALVALFNATAGANWLNKTNWLTTEPISEWFGVGTSSGGVTVLQLHSNNLTGSIPEEIGNMNRLTRLDLNHNQLSGSIPSELGNLKNLQYFLLYNNQLSGTIPIEIGNLTNLTDLVLFYNQFTGTIPSELGNLINLRYFYLNYNQFTGTIPSELGNLTKVLNLYLDHNKLTGLPNLGGFPPSPRLIILNNQLDFADMESAQINWNAYPHIYAPQDSVGIKQDIIRIIGDDFSFTVSVGGTSNEYQWYKNNNIIPSANGSTYTITSLDLSDAGSYTCAVTNPVAMALTIYSRPINLQVSTTTDIYAGNIPNIRVFPNPASTILTIELTDEFAQNCSLELLDYLGRVVLIKNIKGETIHELDLSGIPKGMYFIKVQNTVNYYFQKIVIN